MDQTGALTISVPLFVGSIALTWFLLTRAHGLPRELSERAVGATVRIRLVRSSLLRDLRNELNIALREYDEGSDPFLTRVDYQVPSELLRRYRRLMQLEKAARHAPYRVQKRLQIAVLIAIVLTVLFFASSVLAALESIIGLLPCYIALCIAGILVTLGFVLAVFFFVIPYSQVGKAELRGLGELKMRPGLHGAAEALNVQVEQNVEGVEW